MPGRYWLAPTILLLLQSAPVTLTRDPRTGLRLALGGAAGEYEEQGVNCNGDVIARERRRFGTAGAEASGRLSRTTRMTGHAGYMWTGSEPGSTLAPPFRGFFGGVMAGLDDDKLAMGLGISTAPGGVDTLTGATSQRVLPMGFVRLGALDNIHFRVEVGGPPAPGSPPELGRAGLGFRLGEERRLGFRLDLGVSDFPLGDGENHLQLDALVRWPLGRAFDLGFLGSLRDPAGGNVGFFAQFYRR